MTTEALVPAVAEPAVVIAGGGKIALPQGDRRRGAGGGEVPGVLRGADREREDAGGVRAVGGSSFWRGARREASSCAPSRRSTWPPTSGPNRDHGVLVERGTPRACAADRGARVAQDDEALRPDGGHGDGRRDRAHRDLTGAAAADEVDPDESYRDGIRTDSRRRAPHGVAAAGRALPVRRLSRLARRQG